MGSDQLAVNQDELATIARHLSDQAAQIDQLNRAYQKQVAEVYQVWSGKAQENHSKTNAQLNAEIKDIHDTCYSFSEATKKAGQIFADVEQQNASYYA